MMKFNFLKREYMNWDDYKKKIDFLEDYNFQQNVRKQNIKILS